MSDYFRTEEMMLGKPFKCYNCGKMLIKKVSGSSYEITLICPRCKSTINIVCKESIPFIENENIIHVS